MNYMEYQFSIHNQPTVCPVQPVNFGFNRLLQSAARRGDYDKIKDLRQAQINRHYKTWSNMMNLQRGIRKTLPHDSPERDTLKKMFKAATNTFDRQADKNKAATTAAFDNASNYWQNKSK